jgi:DNA-binding HxlR family transcriptional regulator
MTTMKSEKITAGRERWYDDACGTAHALELVGERWSLLIMRELMFGPRRFSELKRSLPGLSANVLTQRLDGLDAAGLLTRRTLPPPANVGVYELTPWGYEAEAVIGALGRWAARSPRHDPTLPLSPASIMLSLTNMIVPERAAGLRMAAAFRFGAESYRAEITDGTIRVARGEPNDAELLFQGAPEGVAALIYSGADRGALDDAGMLSVHGDAEALARFVGLFSLPPKAGLPG